MNEANSAQVHSRLRSLDLLKGLAVMAMIQVHITELFAVPVWQQSVLGRISLFLGGPAAAPMFMVVMGYLAGFSGHKTGYLIRRGSKLLLWGLLLNIGMNVHLFMKIWIEAWPQNPLHYLFGVDILFLAGFSLIILALLSATGKFSYSAALVLLIVVLFASYLEPWSTNETIPVYLMAFIHSDAAWSYFPLVPWAAYPLSGFVASGLIRWTRMLALSEWHYGLMAFAGLLVLAITFNVGWNAATSMDKWYHHQAPVVFWNLLFVATIAALAVLITKAFDNDPATNFLCWNGRNVTAFYVIQWLIIGNIATLIYQTQYPLQLLMWFVVVIITSAVLVLLWNRAKQQFLHLQLPKS